MLLGHITSNLSQFLFFLLQALFLRTQIPCHAIQIKNSLLFRASFRQRRRFVFSFLESVATFDLCIKRKWIFCKFKMLDHGTIKNLFKNSRIFTIHCFFLGKQFVLSLFFAWKLLIISTRGSVLDLEKSRGYQGGPHTHLCEFKGRLIASPLFMVFSLMWTFFQVVAGTISYMAPLNN